jgi:hypothetical protein
MYYNGTSVATATSSANFTSGTLTIANDGSYGIPAQYISNLRIVKGTAVYTSAFTPSTTPLTAISGTSLLTCQGNRFLDASSNAAAITITGSPSVQSFSPFVPLVVYNPAVNGGSAYFDGTGDYLNIANQSALHLGGSDFSIECWTYLTSTSGAQRPISQNDSNYEFAFYIANGGAITAYSFQSSGTQNFGISGGTLVTNQWYHLACTRTGSTVAFFVNGVRQGTATYSGTVDSETAGWRIGANGSGTDLQKGYITDVRMVFGSNPYGVGTTLTVPTTPLTAISSTGLLLNYTNAGILDNAMMNDLETVGNAQISTSVKKYGTGSMYFDGTGDYLQAADSPIFNFGSGDWTIEGWLYINSAKSYNGWFGKRQTGLYGLTLQIDSSNVLSISASTTGSSWALAGASLGGGYSAGAWMHVAVTRSGTTITGWLNGTSTGTQTLSGSIFAATGYVATIGSANDSGQEFNGYIDDFRITRGYARYTTTFTPPTVAFPNG